MIIRSSFTETIIDAQSVSWSIAQMYNTVHDRGGINLRIDVTPLHKEHQIKYVWEEEV